ncbi:hypothetical protein EHYA_04635 [Embleya hyalina]|uniref:Uncharacterized protein n=1 Tax=Embleya hyalina TaxID=516124 RepID=A0A401YQQ7_9ACTN|nr:hypothetical protein EHYA_04635 [Embleya hyalina]
MCRAWGWVVLSDGVGEGSCGGDVVGWVEDGGAEEGRGVREGGADVDGDRGVRERVCAGPGVGATVGGGEDDPRGVGVPPVFRGVAGFRVARGVAAARGVPGAVAEGTDDE